MLSDLKYYCMDNIIVLFNAKDGGFMPGIPEGTIISGFISKIINDGVDISKPVIKKVIENQSSKNQNLQTKIYQVIINSINEVTRDCYKEQDIIYDVAEKILKGFKNNKENHIEAVKYGLSVFGEHVNDEKCEEFIGLLCREISKEEYIELYHEINLLLKEQESRKTSRIEQKVNELDWKIEQGFYEVKQGLDIKKDDVESDNTKQKVKIRT